MTGNRFLLEELKRTPLEHQRIELVERKGKGHPDSPCDAVAEVYVWLCSHIGQPINMPLTAAVQVILKTGVGLPDVQPTVETVIQLELSGIHPFSERLARGELPVW